MVTTSCDYNRILLLGISCSTVMANASHSSMLEIALLQQTWKGFENLCRQSGYDVFKAWKKELQVVSLQLRKQLMYLNIAPKISNDAP